MLVGWQEEQLASENIAQEIPKVFLCETFGNRPNQDNWKWSPETLAPSAEQNWQYSDKSIWLMNN